MVWRQKLQFLPHRRYLTGLLVVIYRIITGIMADTNTKTDLKPLGDKVVLRALTDEEAGTKSASGIILPDSVGGDKEKGEQGIIIAVGPGRTETDGGKRIPLEVSVGDRVIFKSWSGTVKVDKEEFWVISESDILAVIG